MIKNRYLSNDDVLVPGAFQDNNDGTVTFTFHVLKSENRNIKKLTPEEKVFDAYAKRNIKNWNIQRFKKTHNRLFKSIIQSIKHNQNELD